VPRSALITGASSGIGLGIARALGRSGYGLTVVARRAEKLNTATNELRELGIEVESFAGDLGDETAIVSAVDVHRKRFGGLDVLVNNAGVGIGQYADELTAKAVDVQLSTNLRSMMFLYREAIPMLRQAATEHRNANVINLSSYSGIRGAAWLGVYSATKHGVVGFTQAMNRELADEGIKSTALCPAFVATPMTGFLGDSIGMDSMITVDDISEAVLFVLRMSPGCVIPEIQFEQPKRIELPQPPRAALS
jgi:NAD(P)-dependent dehydrogenase (short-subunit alcohol dehydrogenase family)